MKKYFDYLWTLAFTKTAKSTYLTTFGAGLNALLGFIFTIVAARSISPANFGLFSVVMNFLMILFVICDVGLSSSVLRFLPKAIRDGQKVEAQKIIKLAFLATLVIGGILAILIFLLAAPIAIYIFTQHLLVLPLIIVSVSLVGLTLSFLSTSILQAQQRFLFGVITDSSVVLLKVIGTLILLFFGKLSLTSILVVYTFTSFTGFILGIFFIGHKFLLVKTDLVLAKTLFVFGFWVALARIANAISSRLDTLMLIRFVETSQVGFYAAAQRMTFIFPVILNGMTVVLTPKFSSLKTKEEARSFIKKSVLLMSLLVAPIVILFFLSPWLTVKIYGTVYAPSSTIFRWLLVSSFFFIASSIPVTVIIYFLGKAKLFFAISVIQLMAIFIGNIILIPKVGVIGPAISLALAYGLSFILSLFIINNNFGKKK